MVVVHLGWVDSDLGSSPGWWAATAPTYSLVSNQLPVHPDSELESFELIQSQLKRLFDSVILIHFS